MHDFSLLPFIFFSKLCNFKAKCEELSKFITEHCPNTQVDCHTGRRGAFEVQINNTLIHSKLQSVSFPEYGDVVRNVQLAANGEPVQKAKEQPITDCVIQ